MPGFNRQGPLYNGPRSGRGCGFCGRNQRRVCCFNPLSKVENLQLLEDELQLVEREKQNIIEEISRLKK